MKGGIKTNCEGFDNLGIDLLSDKKCVIAPPTLFRVDELEKCYQWVGGRVPDNLRSLPPMPEKLQPRYDTQYDPLYSCRGALCTYYRQQGSASHSFDLSPIS